MALSRPATDSRLRGYLSEIAEPEPSPLRSLRETTSRHEHGYMQSAPEQMALIGMLLRLNGARRILEVGCFTGYGTLAMAMAAPSAQLTTLDVNRDWAEIGRHYWIEAGVAERIEFIEGLALESLHSLCAKDARFDFVYIDADKKSYPAYLDIALDLIGVGGWLALDNMLWGGAVADPEDRSKQVLALRAVAERLRDDPNMSSSLVPIGDGLMLARKER